MMKKSTLLICLLVCVSNYFYAQQGRWQQKVDYRIEVDMNVENHQFTGRQAIDYTNNSPDTLSRLFYHLYLNAFQPNSEMDIRSRTISDPDPRVADRIHGLSAEEIGYTKVKFLKHNGKDVFFKHNETILEVFLTDPILPGETVKLEMEFESQMPIQIRRNGRDSKEGIAYSMAQWYPKLCEYDFEGWHVNSYIGREFHGIWGNFDVKITIDKSYILGASGVLQNANEIGYGYSSVDIDHSKKKYDKLTWHFVAENVHDFVWAADTKYKHVTRETKEGVKLHFLYVENDRTREPWSQLPDIMVASLTKLNRLCGPYPFPVYSFIQGGDGGMEYPMATLITGERNIRSLVGVSIHEWVHSWYQMILGVNESRLPWMDEGFTSWATALIVNELNEDGLVPGGKPTSRDELFQGSFNGYKLTVVNEMQEPLNTHADHYSSNTVYGINSYSKGALYLEQLSYVIGEENLLKTLHRFYDEWKFKHPNENDFIRTAEKVSDMQLRWYNEYWVNSIKFIDYGIDTLVENAGGGTTALIYRYGEMPMPLDVQIQTKDNKTFNYYFPLKMMYGMKKEDSLLGEFSYIKHWSWVDRAMSFEIPVPMSEIQSITIDPSKRMMDVNRDNNVWSATSLEEKN